MRVASSLPTKWIAAAVSVAIAVVLSLAPQQPAAALSCPATPHLPSADASDPPNLGVLKLHLLDYVCFGAYERDVKRVLANAQAYMESRAGQVMNPAIVLDIDETALSNWQNIAADDFGFIPNGPCNLTPGDPCGFNEWIASQKATAIEPTLQLAKAARAMNVAVFFVSGRNISTQKEVTEQNLKKVGYPEWQGMFLKPMGEAVTAFKTASRKQIEEKEHFTIIANIGDQQSDLDGGYAERAFRVPNPFYYIP